MPDWELGLFKAAMQSDARPASAAYEEKKIQSNIQERLNLLFGPSEEVVEGEDTEKAESKAKKQEDKPYQTI